MKNTVDFTVQIADVRIGVMTSFEMMRKHFRSYLCQDVPTFSVAVTGEDVARERQWSERENLREGRLPRGFTDDYLAFISVQRKIAEWMFLCDTLLFHGSTIAVDGEAYLFTAKSGTGKSTHTRFWREVFGERAVMVNDDKPFLKFEDGRVIACGSPWNGKHRLGSNTMVPLKAICILERGETNEIHPISAQEALPMLFQQSARPRNPALMGKYMELVDRLTNGVQFYRMRCTMSQEAAKMAYEAMK